MSHNQLQYVLTHYQLGTGTRIPFGWNPPVQDVLPAAQEEALTESFNNHPPLVLPGDGFLLDLTSEVIDASFYDLLGDFNTQFAPKEGKISKLIVS